MYLLSFIKFPKWAIKALNTHLANCLWNDSEGNHRYHLANWESISMPKDFGGLGVPNIRDLKLMPVRFLGAKVQSGWWQALEKAAGLQI